LSQLLGSKFKHEIVDQIKKTTKSILIISPYATLPAVKEVVKVMNKSVNKRILITVPPGVEYVNGSVDVEALELLHNNGFEIRYLRNLHAKIYLLDEKTAFVGSANFTKSGWEMDQNGNVEDTIRIDVSKSERDHINSRYTAASSPLDMNGAWKSDVEKIKATFLKQYRKLMDSVEINFSSEHIVLFSGYRHPPKTCKHYFQFNLAKVTGDKLTKDKCDLVLELGGEKGSPHATITVPFKKFGTYLTEKYLTGGGENWQFQLCIDHREAVYIKIKGEQIKFQKRELKGVLKGEYVIIKNIK
jgi:hypothetical protein